MPCHGAPDIVCLSVKVLTKMCEIIIFLVVAVCAKEHFIRLSCPIRAFIVIISVSTSGGKNSHWWQPAGQGSNSKHCLAEVKEPEPQHDNNCGQVKM